MEGGSLGQLIEQEGRLEGRLEVEVIQFYYAQIIQCLEFLNS